MCPVCLTTTALTVAGVTSASGLAALVANRLRARAAAPPSCAPVMGPAARGARDFLSRVAGSPADARSTDRDGGTTVTEGEKLMRRHVVLVAGLLLVSSPAFADPPTGNAANARLDAKGARIEKRMDARGDAREAQLDARGAKINAHMDERAAKAAANGHEKNAARLDKKGDRIEKRLEHRGARKDARLDAKGARIEKRMDERGDRIDARRGGSD